MNYFVYLFKQVINYIFLKIIIMKNFTKKNFQAKKQIINF